ncbi:Uncharacterised protein [Pseudomonas luteola]|uniref:Uncharacterized protein n=1 Tax=Pseudomonas luteola TaxID=47886 RepID=A0A2X2EHF2_PSELU|nr:hypothetical protein [Pseudomonas luteola]SPZ07609.1 Uncharacterised protein [Pseudomonas luteola]
MSEIEIKPCPCCGAQLPFQHITFNCVVLRCDCGLEIRNGAAQTMYKRDELPKELEPYSYEPTGLVIKNGDTEIKYPEHGYIGVNAIAALKHSGALDKWNRRV